MFRFTSAAHLGLGSERDVINGFAGGTDTIDVAEIDAREGIPGDQAFTFVGTGNFTAGGQIRAVQVGFDTVLQFNTAGPGGAEFELVLTEVIAASLTHEDFAL